MTRLEPPLALVIAGNRTQFLNWCGLHNMNPSWFYYVTNRHQLLGWNRGTMLVRVGLWYLNRDIYRMGEFMDETWARGFEVRDANY